MRVHLLEKVLWTVMHAHTELTRYAQGIPYSPMRAKMFSPSLLTMKSRQYIHTTNRMTLAVSKE
jgi:hypothetical protein